MLTLLTPGGSIPLKVDDYYIRELASGLDELNFSISVWDDDYTLIQEESSIKEESDGSACFYLVKAIDGGKDRARYAPCRAVRSRLARRDGLAAA